jgi:chemotaxis protein MotB
MVRLASALALCATAAAAQEAEPDPTEGLSRIEAHACVVEGEAILVLVRRDPGGLVALGDLRGAQVVEAGGALTLVEGNTVLQVNRGASIRVTDGIATTIVCTTATDALAAALTEVLDDPLQAASSLDQGASLQEIERLRAESEDLSRRLAEAILRQEEAEGRAEAAGASDAELRARLASALEEVSARDAARAEALSEAERQAALLATAQAQLAQEEAVSAEGRREVEALNAQVAELRAQVGSLQELLDLAETADAAADVQIEALGADLNTALARVAQEQRARAELEAEARARAEAEAQDLASYRSEFFGEVRRALEGREGVQVVGDRFVFSSEVLFPPGSATLSPAGRAQVAQVAGLLREVLADIPEEIPWVIRVDGHTDDIPLSAGGRFRDNWELSQARALSVVRQMSEVEGLPPERLAANGFGEFQPIDTTGTPEGRARNRRIEIKLTER